MLGVGLAVTGAAARGRRSAFNFASLFSGGELGAIMSPSALAGLFQDEHGQLPAVAPGDPVALALTLGISQGVAVKPLAQSLGAELVVDGVFDNPAAWVMNNGATVAGGFLNLGATNDAGKQNLPGTQGALCLVSFDTVRTSGTNVRVYLGGELVWDNNAPTGSYTLALMGGSASDECQIRSNGFVGTIDNLSVKVIQPLSERITGLGPELVTNGGFENDLDNWSQGQPLTYSVVNGALELEFDANNYGNVYQQISTEAGSFYLVSLDVGSLSDGSSNRVTLEIGTSGNGQPSQELSVGQNEFVMQATGAVAYLNIKIESGNSGTLRVDNVSAKKIPGFHAVQNVDTQHAPVLARRPVAGQPDVWGLWFDGIDDYMIIDFAQELQQPTTVMAAFEFMEHETTMYLYDGSVSTRRQALYRSGNAYLSAFAGLAIQSGIPAGPMVSTVIYDGADSIFRLNGNETPGDAGTTHTRGFTIGARHNRIEHFQGFLSGLAVIDRRLTAAEAAKVEAHYAKQIGVTL